MLFRWITPILILALGIRGYHITLFKLYGQQMEKYNDVEPETENDACFIHYNNYDLYVVCPTDVNCCLHTHFRNDRVNVLSGGGGNDKVSLKSPCKTKNNKRLPVSKTLQLKAVLRILSLVNQTVCEFSSIETLDVRHSGLANMRQVGRANCRKDNEELGQCPYELKYLSFGNLKIEHLFNNSFCQFRKLEFLGILDCGLRSIEAAAFVHLVHLKEISFQRNQLTHLPISLFKNNIHLQTVDLMENQLQFPALSAFLTLSSLRNLFLSRNKITFANDRLRFPSKLEQITLDNNQLGSIRLEFANLKHSQYLVMSNGGVNRIDENAFQRLLELRVIDLGNNNIESLPPNTFKNNFELEELWLANNRLMDFPPIAHLRNLREVELDRNRIGFINNSHLVNCTRLTVANLSYNELSFVEAGAFDNVVQLQQLSLRHNRLTQFTIDFSRANILEMSLDFNNFTSFSYQLFPRSLIHLSISHNRIETIQPFDFTQHQREEWSLTLLILNNNRIKSIKQLRLPPSIEEIDLSHNLITDVLSMKEVVDQKLTKLWSIDLRGNRILTLCETLFAVVGKRVIIGETGYYISGNPLRCSCENMWLKHSSNSTSFTFEDLDNVECRPYNSHSDAFLPLTQLNDDQFLCQSDHSDSNRCKCPPDGSVGCEVPCPTNCTCLSDYSKTNIYFMCNSRQFTSLPTDLRYTYYAGSIANSLDLSGNCISHLEIIDFADLSPTFVLLNLYNCGVKSIQQNAFDDLVNLRNLNLANNEIEALPEIIFHQLKQLTQLDLSNNRLKVVADDAFTSQIVLQYLYLRNNSLSHVELSQILRMKRLSNVTLDDNPWSCDCTFILSLQPFLSNSSTVIHDKQRLNCTKNGEEFNISTFDVEPCLTQINLTILIVSLTLGLVTVITIGLVYRWRFELRVIVYARYGFRMFHRGQPEEDVSSKEYDAFVAYNSEDTDFLIRQLMPGLEAIANPYHLCIHERDFPDDLYIQDSLLEAIAASSRTIILLSDSFVQSGWCAHMQMLEDRCPRILVVVVGEVPENLDPEMKLYLTSNTCLRWGERLFWQKLYYAMPDKRVSAPPAHYMPLRNL